MSSAAALLKEAVQTLKSRGTDEPDASAEVLLAAASGCGRAALLAFAEQPVSAEKEALFRHFLARRLAGEPVSHILGYTDFCGLRIHVTPQVLTPRPETEELVLFASEFFRPQHALNILDLCTGSGCIALALADLFPHASVTAVDLSPEALTVAQDNAARLNLSERVRFTQSDLFENVSGTYDLIISNPPYIPTADLAGLQAEVLREPRLALDGGADGLDLVRRIVERAEMFAAPGALLALELGINEAACVRALLDGRVWKSMVKKDIVGIDRFVLAKKIN